MVLYEMSKDSCTLQNPQTLKFPGKEQHVDQLLCHLIGVWWLCFPKSMLFQAGMTADNGNAVDPEGKLWCSRGEWGGSVCPCPFADSLGESSESRGTGHRGGPCSDRGQLGAWPVSFSGSRFGVLVSRLAPSPERAGKRQGQGCQVTQTLSASRAAAKGAGVCGWGRETPREEIQ